MGKWGVSKSDTLCKAADDTANEITRTPQSGYYEIAHNDQALARRGRALPRHGGRMANAHGSGAERVVEDKCARVRGQTGGVESQAFGGKSPQRLSLGVQAESALIDAGLRRAMRDRVPRVPDRG